MADVGALTVAVFADRVGEDFHIRTAQDQVVDVVLAEAITVGQAPAPQMRAPFSIIFSGPAEAILPQGVYAVEHDTIGGTELFLVPLEPDASGARYQAIFS